MYSRVRVSVIPTKTRLTKRLAGPARPNATRQFWNVFWRVNDIIQSSKVYIEYALNVSVDFFDIFSSRADCPKVQLNEPMETDILRSMEISSRVARQK